MTTGALPAIAPRIAVRFELVDTADMTMTTATLPHRLSLAAVGLRAGAGVADRLRLAAAGADALPSWSTANRSPITTSSSAPSSNFLTTHKQPSRQEVINELIDEKVKIKEGKKFGVDPTSSDIDQSFAAMSSRMRITPDQLTKSLESQGIRAETLKARLKADMVWTSLVRGRFKESLQVGEKDVDAAAQEGGEKTETEAFEYQMQPIVLIVPRGSRAGRDRSAKQGSRGAARARPELRGGQFLFQVDAERRDPRDRDQDLGRHSRPASRTARQDADRPSDRRPRSPSRAWKWWRCAAASRPPSIRRRSGKSATRCTPQKYEAKSKAYLQEVRKAAMIEYR